jgi:hypothetical protein
MVPVRECQNKLFTILILVGIFWIVDDQGSTESVWILAFIVGMIPVGARLVKLDDLTLEDGLRNLGLYVLTVKLYVKLEPGWIGH